MSNLDTICVELTLRCPLRCIHCSANAGPRRHESIATDLLVRRLAEVGHLKALYLSGGEPFEHPHLTEIAQIGKTIADEVVIYSSAVVTHGQTIAPLPEHSILSVAQHINRIDVSLYSLSDAEHDAITGTSGSLRATLESLQLLRYFRIPIGIHFVPLCGDNALVQVANYASDIGAQRLHVLAVARQGRATLTKDISPPLRTTLQSLTSYASKMEILLSSQLRRSLGMEKTNRDLLRASFIDSQGYLYPGEGMRARQGRSLRTLKESQIENLIADMA